MKVFKINSHEEVEEQVKLSNVLHLYETIEQSLFKKLIESVNSNFRAELSKQDCQITEDSIFAYFSKLRR